MEGFYINQIRNTKYPILKKIPEIYRTWNVCHDATTKFPSDIKYLPSKYQTVHFYINLLKIHKQKLEDIPLHVLANKEFIFFLHHIINVKLLNVKLLLILIEWRCVSARLLIIYNNSDPEFYKECIKRKMPLCYVPRKYVTYDLCIDAIIQSRKNILNVPTEMFDTDMCKKIITNYGLWELPRKYCVYELYLFAYRVNVFSFYCIPKKYFFRYSEFCKKPHCYCPFNIQRVRHEYFINKFLFIKN